MTFSERVARQVRRLGQPWELALFAWIPLLVLGFTAWYELHYRETLGDMSIFRAASEAVIRGDSPYAAANTHALAGFDTFVYPPAAAFLFSPLALVPYTAAKVLLLGLGLASVLGALALLGVRDWRCYGVAAVSAPVVNSLALGAFSTFLLLGAAAVWRYRDHSSTAGATAAVTGVVKLFLWPLGWWLLVTRRRRPALVFACVALTLIVAGWAAIGFAGFGSYPRLLQVLSDVETKRSFSLVALLGLTGGAGAVASVSLCAVVAGATWAAARTDEGDRRAFAVAILGALVATPIVWMHYDVLLFAPIALYRPRLSPLWFVPLVLWLNPSSYSEGVVWRIVLGLAVVAAVAVGMRAAGPRRYIAVRMASGFQPYGRDSGSRARSI